MKLKLTSYLPALDGLRAISIALVVLSHVLYYSKLYEGNIIPGGFGVTIFFFISGFLITRLLLSELKKTNRINIRMFYIRRILRLYPPLLAMLVCITLFLVLVKHFIPYQELLAAIFYLENYFTLLVDTKSQNYAILWSLAVEEHFYLFYPLLFLIFPKNPKRLLLSVIFFTIIPLIIRCLIAHRYNANDFSYQYTYTLSHCRFDSILYGCISALILNSLYSQKYLGIVSNKWIYSMALGAILFTLTYRNEFFRETFRYSLQGLALMVIVPPIVFSESYSFFNKVLSIKSMVFIGKLSYSIYLFHFVVIKILDEFPSINKLNYVVVFSVGTAILSLASYQFVEKPFFRLRKRFGSKIQEETIPGRQFETEALVADRI